MNKPSIILRNIALAAIAALAPAVATAQTAIIRDYSWYGSTDEQMSSWGTFAADHFYKHGQTVDPNANYPVTINGNTYPTYNLQDINTHAVKMTLGQGDGTVKVYYNTINAISLSPNQLTMGGTAPAENQPIVYNTLSGSTVTFVAGWNGGASWFNDNYHGHSEFSTRPMSKFTLKLKSQPHAPVRVIVRYRGGGETESYTAGDPTAKHENWPYPTDVTEYVVVPPTNDKVVSEIYLQNSGSGDIEIESAILEELTDNNSAIAVERGFTSQLSTTDSNVKLYSGTTLDGRTATVSGQWGGFAWTFNDRNIKLTSATVTLDLSAVPESERASARLRVIYKDHPDDDAYADMVPDWPDRTQATFTVTPSAEHADWYISEIRLQPSAQLGRWVVASAELQGVEVVDGSAATIMRPGQTGVLPTSVEDLGNNTKVVTYSFSNEDNTDVWFTGGRVGAVIVDFDETTIRTAPDLVPITQDFLWYYNGGGGIWNEDYSNNSRLYRFLNGGFIPGEDTTIYVNGEQLDNDGTTDNASKHSYRLSPSEAIGFKLDPSKTYRIRVLHNNAAGTVLYKGVNALTSTAVTASNNVKVLSATAGETNTYLTTYEITGSGDTYWVRNAEGQFNLGGFEILPIENTSSDLSGKAAIPAVTTTWWVDDYAQDQANECGSLNGQKLVRAGDKGSYVYISGPDLPLHHLSNDGHRFVRVNDGTRIGFRIPAGSQLTFTYAGDAGSKVKVLHNGTEVTGDCGGAWHTFKYPADVNNNPVGAPTDETIWITSNDANYVFIQGFTVTPIAANDAPDPTVITDDYIWYSGETIAPSSLFGSNYLANNGVGKSLVDGESVKVDGQVIGVYDLSRSTGNFRLLLDNNLGNGEIRVFWKPADLATPERLDLTANLPSYDWADFHNITSNSGQTITYAYTNYSDGDAQNEYPGRGYQLTPSTGKYDRVTVNLSSNPNNFYWHIVPIYQTGNGGASAYTTGTTLTADLDPDLTLVAIVIQGAIGKGETKTITVGSIEFNRLGKAAGTVENTTLYSYDSTNGEQAVGNGYTVEGTDYITYRVTNSSPREYHIKGGFVAAVEVFAKKADDNLGNITALTAAQIENKYTWNVEQGLGTTINNGTTPMVLNASTAHDGKVFVYGNGEVFGDAQGADANIPREKDDLAINATLVNGQRTVLLDKYHAVGIKVPGGGKYKVTAYWNNVDDAGGVRFLYRTGTDKNFSREPVWVSDVQKYDYTERTQQSQTFDFSSLSDEQVIWIGGSSHKPIYFSGFKIETYKDYSIVIDDRQPGIFTGKYKGDGDSEEKLLVYLSDNGKYESFRAPRVYYRDATNSGNDRELTTAPSSVDLVRKLELKDIATNNPSDPTIVSDGQIGGKDVFKVYGFEDTDNDRLYKLTYSYTRTYTEEGVEKTETLSDYYYIWYANFLKIGWWTNREAKLIVDTSNSYEDPDHIIVGEFYVSSGETADFYYDVINPGKDTAGNVVGVSSGNGTTYGYGNAIFDEAEWTITTDNGNTQTRTRKFNPTATEKKSNNVDPEEFSWTKMNDHKNHTGDAISLAYPTDPSAWNGGEVVKSIVFLAKRTGWPDWSAHLKFHFVEAPTLSAQGPTTYKTVTMTPADRRTGTSTDGKIYYTTDGTNPTTIDGNPTNQTYVYNAGNKPVNRQLTVYYAAERVTMPRQFYIHNPYTTHIEGETMYTLMDKASNKSYTFLAVSKELEAPVVDPIVEYVNADRNIISKSRDNVLTTTTGYDEWGIDDDQHSVSALGVGGFLYKYPFAQQRRDVMVLFGNADKPVYRENVFKNVGVYWGVDENDAFAEHFDALLYKWKTMGYNYDSTHGGNNGDSQNVNPQTECNGGIGGEHTEQGGLWLQPISGDFLRFEPEYDGVITVWLRTNGAAQGDEYYGDITRCPVYVVDENGKVMKRSTVKPTQDDYFGIDGLYAEICTNRSTVRHDCRTDWVNGLASWKSGFKHDADEGLPWRNMATFRLYNYWYGFPLFQNKNVLNHTARGETDPAKARFSMDVADSWVSRTANVKSVQCEFNSIVYHSEQLHNDIEKSDDIKFVHGDGTDGNVYSGDKFALYGWEIPSYNVVRYRFPVKAGKSYYIGGRGTKNGYMGMKFEPLPANYKPSDYRNADYRQLYEGTTADKNAGHTAFTAYSGVTGSYSYASYNDATARNSYNNKVDMNDAMTASNAFTDANSSYVPTYDLWETPPSGLFNSWYGEQGVSGHANLLFQNFDTEWWTNGQRALVNENSVVGHTCNVRLYRQFTKGYWHPIVLPFSVSESRMKEIFGDEVQVLYLDPYNNVMKSKNETVGLGSNGEAGEYVSALNPAVSYEHLRFTWHHYQMLYANVPAFVCPGGRRKVNGTWTSNWTTFGTKENSGTDAKANAVLFERVTLDRSNLTDNSYDKIGYKIGETGNFEYWVTGSYTPGMKGAEDGVYYLTNELTDQDGEQKMRAVIYHSPNGKTLKATRCWIAVRRKTNDIPYGQPPLLTNVGFTDFQGLDIDINDVPSGIQDVIFDEVPEGAVIDDNVYDVLGRIVGSGTTDGLPSGVYIFRGRKIYVR